MFNNSICSKLANLTDIKLCTDNTDIPSLQKVVGNLVNYMLFLGFIIVI